MEYGKRIVAWNEVMQQYSFIVTLEICTPNLYGMAYRPFLETCVKFLISTIKRLLLAIFSCEVSYTLRFSLVLWQKIIQDSVLPILGQGFISIPPENIGKFLVFWCFKEYRNETIAWNELSLSMI